MRVLNLWLVAAGAALLLAGDRNGVRAQSPAPADAPIVETECTLQRG